MVRRGELTNKSWERIAPLLPGNSADCEESGHRQMVNAVFWKLRTGTPWRDLPGRYGPWQTVRERLRNWTEDGTWQKILAEAVVKDDAVGEVEWGVSDDTLVAHLHERAALIRSRPAPWEDTAEEALDEEE